MSEYQGYTNAQTWCVALTLNNTKKHQNEAMRIIENNKKLFKDSGFTSLEDYCYWIRKDIYNMATWCWLRGVTEETLKQVDWKQIEDEIQNLINEGGL